MPDEPVLDHIAEGLRHLAVPVDSLTLDPQNARKHGDRNLDAIRHSLDRFGQRMPLVVQREGMIVRAGNGRLECARALGWSHVAAVVVDEADAEAMAYALADNRTAELAEWDVDVLLQNLDTVQPAGFGAVDLGFDTTYLSDLRALNGNAGPLEREDPGPGDPPSDPVSVLGGVWEMGQHRVLCGDSREPGHVAKLFDGELAALVFTSPPYAEQRKYDEASGFQPVEPGAYVDWWEALQSNVAERLAPDGSFFVNIKPHCEDGQRHLYVLDLVAAHVRRWGWQFVDEFCWQRVSLPGRYPNRFKNGWEPVFHFSRSQTIKFRPDNVLKDHEHLATALTTDQVVAQGRSTGFTPDGSGGGPGSVRSKVFDGALPDNVLKANGVASTGHVAAFPVGLPAFFVRAFSDEADVVYDPFMGSGTTLMAAHQHGRVALGMEISPRYCDVIAKRWCNLTGQIARLLVGGELFSEMAPDNPAAA